MKHLSYILRLQSLQPCGRHSVAERSAGVCSRVHGRYGFFGVVVIHESLLYVKIGWQLVFVKLHVRGDHLKRGEEQAADGAAIHERTRVRL